MKIKVRRCYLNDEFALAKRIAAIVVGTHAEVQETPPELQGYKWQLHVPGNDWKMSGIEDGCVEVHYRYGGGGNQPMMDALKVVLEWMVGPQ